MKTPSPDNRELLLRRVRWLTAFFILGLVLSGVTAIPLKSEVDLLVRAADATGLGGAAAFPELRAWLVRVQAALADTDAQRRFLFYGTDWLAFGHLVIAVAFVGAWRDPVRNRWLFDFGLMACALVVPWALVFGALRGLPWWWRAVDCSFGVCGAVPLWLARRWVTRMTA